jgi:thiamine-monophosphate kinase
LSAHFSATKRLPSWDGKLVRMARKPVKSLGELALIEQIRVGAGRSARVRVGIGDDCAVLRVPAGHEMVVTTDFSLENRHFRRDWHSPRAIGHRVLARGLSDLAAMGAEPVAAFLSLALPNDLVRSPQFLWEFLGGLEELMGAFGVPLAGGDTSESGAGGVLADIVLVGSAPAGTALLRSRAKAGDLLYCTGKLGGAAAELAALSKSPKKFRKATAKGDHPHLFPAPRIAAGLVLRKKKLATACMDLSDGLSSDLAHLCEASGVAAEVDAARLPIHPLAEKLGAEAGLDAALNGGEDYELLFTAKAGTKMPRSIGGVPVTCIGRVLARKKSAPMMTLVMGDGSRRELVRGGWEHFEGKD